MPNDTNPGAPAPTLPALPIASAGGGLETLQPNLAPSLRIMLDERLYEQVKRMAGIMSKDTIFTPRHLVGKPEACFTVITQAVNWNLDPQFVARATYQTPGGSIGFEGKLVGAILERSGRFIGAPRLQYVGDWSRVTGKFQKKVSQKGNEFVVPIWTDKDAAGLGIIISWQARGEKEPRVWPGENEPFFLTQCYPLNSPLWATDPKTQIAYLAIRRFASGVAPGILGGMAFDHEDLLDASERARDVTPPPRPRRSDFVSREWTEGGEPEAPQEKPSPTVAIVDADGNESEVPMDRAEAELPAILAEMERRSGKDGVVAFGENNAAALTVLREAGIAGPALAHAERLAAYPDKGRREPPSVPPRETRGEGADG